MLRWTPAGAVSSPTTVQMRLTRRYPDRVQAGAPEPERCLSPAELRANILHFTAGMRGPRRQPCTRLVLSGLGLGQRDDLPAALDLAREQGIETVVVHASPADLAPAGAGPSPVAAPQWRGRIDVLVRPAVTGAPDAAPQLARALAARTAPRRVVGLPLPVDGQPLPAALVAALIEGRPDEVAFTLPFPTRPGAPVPALPGIRSALAAVQPRLAAAGIATTLKGLPPCLGPGLALPRRRTGNRWYVDADHQGDAALLFLPDVVRFHKGDPCRFCVHDADCDGYFAAYLDGPEAPVLRPVTGG